MKKIIVALLILLNSASFANQNKSSDTFYQKMINELINLNESAKSRIERPDEECEEHIDIDDNDRGKPNNRNGSNNRDVEEEGTGGDCINFN